MADELQTELAELRLQLEQKAGAMQEDVQRTLCEGEQMWEQLDTFLCEVKSQVNKMNRQLDETYEAATSAAKQLAEHAAM